MLLASPALADQLNPGDVVGPIEVERWLGDGEPPVTDGKVAVLEFWATWCGPCVAAIPHLNELAAEFEGEDVVFLSVTTENADAVVPFLERTPISGRVGLDTDRGLTDRFGVVGIPCTVLIDREGRLLGYTHPARLTAGMIRAVLDGDPAISHENEPPAEARAVLRPARVLNGAAGREAGPDRRHADGSQLHLENQTAEQIVRQTCLRSPRSVFPRPLIETKLPGGTYDLLVSGHPDARSTLAWETVVAAWNLERRLEFRESDVLLLRRTHDAPVEAERPEAVEAWTDAAASFIDMVDMAPSNFVRVMERRYDDWLVVTDDALEESTITLRLDLPIDASVDDINAQLADQGFELVEARRVLPRMVITWRDRAGPFDGLGAGFFTEEVNGYEPGEEPDRPVTMEDREATQQRLKSRGQR